MKIILTNDDGIEAPGLQILYNCLKDSGQAVVVAPQQPQDDHLELTYQFCGLDTNPHVYDFVTRGNDYIYQGSIHERPRQPGTDVAVCFDDGEISISRIALGTTEFLRPDK